MDNLLQCMCHGIERSLRLAIVPLRGHSHIIVVVAIVVGGYRSHIALVFAGFRSGSLVEFTVKVVSTLQQSDSFLRLCFGCHLLAFRL